MKRPHRIGPGGGRRAALGTLAATVTASLLAGCGLLPPVGLKSPVVTVSDVSVRKIGSGQIDLLVTLEARNPNDVEVPLSNLRFDLDLLGRPFAQGRSSEPTVTLAPNAARSVPIEFSVQTARVIETLRDLRLAGESSFPYQLKGTANWGASPIPLAFERKGEIEALHNLRSVLRPLLRP